jgi:hypothetical protein
LRLAAVVSANRGLDKAHIQKARIQKAHIQWLEDALPVHGSGSSS